MDALHDAAVVELVDHHQHLGSERRIVHRCDQPSAARQLVQPGGGQVVTAGRRDDTVIGSRRAVAEPAVAIDELDPRQLQRRQDATRDYSETR